jgi:hypothetical protein
MQRVAAAVPCLHKLTAREAALATKPNAEPGRRRRQLLDRLLNLIFVVWVVHLLVTGHFVPQALVDLLGNEPPIAVIVEPTDPAVEPQGPRDETNLPFPAIRRSA